jgi:hypothetical protein|nr:hypothetical protein [Kofleriaceae bacterium]
MPRNTQDSEQHKGDTTTDDDEELRDTIPEQRVTRPDDAQDDDDVDEAIEIDLDEMPEFEGPDA